MDNHNKFLNRCIELAGRALQEGNSPFGSILVSKENEIIFEDYNHNSLGDETQHPEFAIARWAAQNLDEEERKQCIVYTSGEHCPMCASAHGIVKLGKIVYASSTEQLNEWYKQMNIKNDLLYNLSIKDIVKNIEIEGPFLEYENQIRNLHNQYLKKLTD